MLTSVRSLRARLAATPVHRLRRFVIALYLIMAAADAGGKALAASPGVNAWLSQVAPGSRKDDVRNAARPGGNFEIFRAAPRHLVAQQDLYAEYPAEHSDRYKYSPAFAMLFAPLAWMPWPLALFLWSCLNAFVLMAGVERVLPPRAALIAMLALHLEVLRAMQNAQSNALVAGLIILAYAALEKRHAFRAAAAVALGACVKIFPLAALTFAIPRGRTIRSGVWAALLGALLIVLPLLVTPWHTLLAQYGWWRGVESSDALQRWFSVMALIQLWTHANLPNWPVQLVGTLGLVAPLAARRARWDEAQFRFAYLCSVLLFVALFNHQAERASYIIAFAGATLWYFGAPATRARTALYVVTFVTIPLMSTLVPGAVFKTPDVMTYRLALPCLVTWLWVQRELWSQDRRIVGS